MAFALASGCGSSSGGPPGQPDSSVNSDAQAPEAGTESGSISCNPFAIELCPQGQTCCFAGLRGTCTDIGACSTPFRIGCVNGASCGSGQVCCGSVQLPAGFDASAYIDASFDASDFDASGFVINLTCASSCPLPEFQACMSTNDCPAGMICGGPAPAGTPTNTNFGLILPCVPADGGFPPFDAGVPDAADAGAPDGDSG